MIERLFLIGWVTLWVSLAAAVMIWIVGIIQEAEAQCYTVVMTENVLVPSIPWYNQVVPVVIGQAVSCL